MQNIVDQLKLDGLSLDGHKFIEIFEQALLASHRERREDNNERKMGSILRQSMDESGFPDVPDEIVDRALERFFALSEALWKPMPGVYDVLESLQQSDMRLGIISNAGDENNVQRMIDNANLRHYFDPILISAAVGIRKPHTRLFSIVLEAWNLHANQVVMIGDLLSADILGAQRVGMHQIWLTADADNEFNRADMEAIIPEATAENLGDVLVLINGFTKSVPQSGAK